MAMRSLRPIPRALGAASVSAASLRRARYESATPPGELSAVASGAPCSSKSITVETAVFMRSILALNFALVLRPKLIHDAQPAVPGVQRVRQQAGARKHGADMRRRRA